MTSSLPIRTYLDRFSYLPGERLELFVDTALAEVDVDLVRLTTAAVGRVRNGLDEAVDWDAAGPYPGMLQETCVGSFGQARIRATAGALSSYTLGCFVWSADLRTAEMGVLLSATTVEGSEVSLAVRGTGLALLGADQAEPQAELAGCLAPRVWYLVTAAVSPQQIELAAIPCDPSLGRVHTEQWPAGGSALAAGAPVTVGARGATVVRDETGIVIGRARDHYTGKIEAPMLVSGALSGAEPVIFARSGRTASETFGDRLVEAWSFSMDSEDLSRAPSTVGGEVMVLANNPTRGVTGRTWTGTELSFVHALHEYGAVHFHSTDLADAGWERTLAGRLPDSLPSGVFGIRVRSGKAQDTTPFIVRAATRSSPVLVLLPLFSYLAYGNEALFAAGLSSEFLTDKPITVEETDQAHVGDPSYGLSMYDTHRDGSGVVFSSLRRPIVNMRAGYRMWLNDGGRAFSAEMYLIEWLTRQRIDFDVACDLDLHREGRALLDPYAVVVSGSHPEYTSQEMLDALGDYRAGGGNLMYLGGNGWYWVAGVHSCDPLIVEVRRGHAGVRCWESLPGEVTLTSTRTHGGLWRHRGRPPQRLAGVGFCAQGWGRSEPYKRTKDSYAPEVSWIFDGVDEDPIGGYGEVMGGAAGDELDRVDPLLGTPEGTIVVASSFGHSNFYQRVIEEIPMNLPEHGGGEEDPEVHADMVYVTWPEGGKAFAVGSIAWNGSLLHNGGDNGVSRITRNVLTRFSTSET